MLRNIIIISFCQVKINYDIKEYVIAKCTTSNQFPVEEAAKGVHIERSEQRQEAFNQGHVD